MRKFILLIGLLLAASLVSVVVGTGVVLADDGPPAAHQAIVEFTGPETCARCHLAAAQEVVESLHYQHQGPVPFREGWDVDSLGGMYVTYSAPQASVAGINWLGILQPEDESLSAQPSGCAQCHAGLGDKPNLPLTDDDLANVDCLICHSPDYQRTVVQDEEGKMRFVPAEGVDILAAAQNSQRPTREMCGRCHLGAAGGPNFKHGDYPTSPEVDVHLVRGFRCVICHGTEDHEMAGGGNLITHEIIDVVVGCARCHTEEPHATGAAAFLNGHTDRVACQTCHIPLIARDADFPTLMTRDYTAPVYNEVEGLYGPTDGTQNDVVPTYFWWNGHWMETSSKPLGSLADAGARITPWKPMEVTVPFDAETDTPIYIDQSVYQAKGDLDAAVLAGIEASGQEYSGEWKAVTVSIYFDAQHQVAPASEALRCSDCHSTEGRLDFVALGYTEAQATRLTSIEFDHTGYSDCSSCHERDAPDSHYSGQCSNCHNSGAWADVTFNHAGYTDCAGCHSALAPEGHYPGQCSDCHNTITWSEAEYLHPDGIDCRTCHTPPPNHWEQSCTDCHTPTSWEASYNHTFPDCKSCHGAPASHYPGQCSDCHNPTNWQDISVQHSEFTECAACHISMAPADHYDLECSHCHTPVSWSQIEVDHSGLIDCRDCHDQDAPADHYDGQCSTCHNTEGWDQLEVDHNALGSCEECHTPPADHWPGECSDCHTFPDWGEIIFVHTGTEDCESCHVPPLGHWPGACTTCHTSQSWNDIIFVHTGLEECESCHMPPLGHWPGACTTCHNTNAWTEIIFDHTGYTDCESCHSADEPADHYDGQCAICHNTSDWSEVSFDHTGYTDCESCHSDDRPPAHYDGQCSACHNTSDWSEVSFDHTGYTDCESCHSDDRPPAHYDGQCSNCHNTSDWADVDFDHDGYTDCQSCHSDDQPPSHYTGQCSNCHNTSDWTDVDFDHDGYTNCRSCHSDDRPADHDPGQCSVCHTTDTWEIPTPTPSKGPAGEVDDTSGETLILPAPGSSGSATGFQAWRNQTGQGSP
jgi:hypothetical protein